MGLPAELSGTTRPAARGTFPLSSSQLHKIVAEMIG